MNILLPLILLSLLAGLVALAVFAWSLRAGQYDDLDGAAWRALMDDEDKPAPDGEPPTAR